MFWFEKKPVNFDLWTEERVWQDQGKASKASDLTRGQNQCAPRIPVASNPRIPAARVFDIPRWLNRPFSTISRINAY